MMEIIKESNIGKYTITLARIEKTYFNTSTLSDSTYFEYESKIMSDEGAAIHHNGVTTGGLVTNDFNLAQNRYYYLRKLAKEQSNSYEYWVEEIMDARLEYLDSDEKYEMYLNWKNNKEEPEDDEFFFRQDHKGECDMSTKTYEIAEFFYNFLPMDDYPTEEAISELAEDIKSLPQDNGLRHGLYTYMLSAYDQMGCYDDIYTPGAFGIVSDFEAENEETYEYYGKRTEQGVLYVDIARFLLRMADMGLLFDYDDNTHYNMIGEALEKAPANIIYVLSSAAENMLRNYSVKNNNPDVAKEEEQEEREA